MRNPFDSPTWPITGALIVAACIALTAYSIVFGF